MTKEIPSWVMKYTPTKAGQHPPGWFVSRLIDTAEKTLSMYEGSVEKLSEVCNSRQVLLIRHYAQHVELHETKLKEFGFPYEKKEGLSVMLAEAYVGCLKRDLATAKYCAETGRNWNRDICIENALISAEALGMDISGEVRGIIHLDNIVYSLSEKRNVA